MSPNRQNRIFRGLIVAVLIGAMAPATVLAAYNTLYFVREQHATGHPSSPTPNPITSDLATGTPAPLCGGPPQMFILLVGSDSRADDYAAGLADSIRIVRIDFISPEVTYLTFQRDLYVEIPGISSHGGITHGKLNQAYLYGNSAFGYFDGPGEGPGLLALTMERNFRTRVDRYVAVNLTAFVQTIDLLGGVDIDLPYSVDGRDSGSRDSERYFAAGPQHLNGYRTMLLARMRPDGDMQRSRTQDLILQALAKKVLAPEMLPKLPGWAQELYGAVQTNLDAEEVSQLLCLAAKLASDNIKARTFPERLFSGTRVQDPVLGYTFVWDADFDVLREYVLQFNNGTWPGEDAGPTTTPTP